MISTITRFRLLALFTIVLLAVPACANFGKHKPKDAIDKAELSKIIHKQLDKSLPRWDKSLLKSPDSYNWSKNLSVTKILSAVEDSPMALPKDVIKNHSFFRDDNRAIRFYADRGEVRYVNIKRIFNPEKDEGKQLLPKEKVIGNMKVLGDALGLMQAEFDQTQVDTQMMTINSKTNKRKSWPIYTLVTVKRKINGIPVDRSQLRFAINPDGKIQRLKINWPRFAIPAHLQLAERETVLKRATESILRYQPSEKLKLGGRLAYINEGSDDELAYTPALLVDVVDGETPFRVVVPLAN